VKFEQDNYYSYDLREPQRKIVNPNQLRETKKPVTTTDDWANIPYYPTKKERREHTAKTLVSQGKAVPESLLKQIEHDKQMEIKTDVFNSNLSVKNNNVEEEEVENVFIKLNEQTPNKQQIQQHLIRQHLLRQHQQQQQQQQYHQYQQPNNQRPKAQASARIRLGGVY
jgi:hypothetical protein